MKNLALNVTLAVAACLTGLVLCELSLRFFHPKYEALAEADYQRDEFRIWKHTPNARRTSRNPDTGSTHSLNYNNFGSRQDRNFSEQELESTHSIGFFGDSYLHNRRMAAPHSFTEPLDYLLNVAGGGTSVLNFGVSGYGTGQSFLSYKDFPHRKDLDHVFYVYCRNDIRNIYETGLFRLGKEGELLQSVPPPPSPWVAFVSRLHISYLFLDIAQRLWAAAPESFPHQRQGGVRDRVRDLRKERAASPVARTIEQNVRKGSTDHGRTHENVEVFKRIVSTWKQQVEGNGGKFHVVLLPRFSSQHALSILENDFTVINLYDCFAEHDPEFRSTSWRDSPYRFQKHGHWNEAGNRLAAVCLYRFLERDMGLPVLSEDGLQEALGRYYSAFEQPGQNPIRARYAALTPVQEAVPEGSGR